TAEPDPLGGSRYVESLTDRLEQEARQYLDKIAGMGGMLAAIETGYVSGEIRRAAYKHQQAVEKKDKIIVGVNEFVSEQPVTVKTHKNDPKLEARRRRELAASRKKRGNLDKHLAALEKAAASSGNLMP